MTKCIKYVGLDVHAETIAVAVSEKRGQVRSLGTIANRPESIRKLMNKLGDKEASDVCYEAGPTGGGIYWQLTQIGRTLEYQLDQPSISQLGRWPLRSIAKREEQESKESPRET